MIGVPGIDHGDAYIVFTCLQYILVPGRNSGGYKYREDR